MSQPHDDLSRGTSILARMDPLDRIVILLLGGVVAVAAVAALISAMARSGDESSPPPNTNVPPAVASGDTAGNQRNDPSTLTPETTSDDTAASADAANAVYDMIAESIADKTDIQTAAQELNSCGDLADAASTFETARDSRATLIQQAESFDTAPLPDLRPVLDALKRAWQFSKRADAAFLAAAEIRPCGIGSDQLAEAARFSAKSHPLKDLAAHLWNRVAPAYSLPTVIGSDL